MTDWVAELKRLRAAAVPAVLVTVAGVRGSAPREVGAKMIVTAHAASGTIGGGELEYRKGDQCQKLPSQADVVFIMVRQGRQHFGQRAGLLGNGDHVQHQIGKVVPVRPQSGGNVVAH